MSTGMDSGEGTSRSRFDPSAEMSVARRLTELANQLNATLSGIERKVLWLSIELEGPRPSSARPEASEEDGVVARLNTANSLALEIDEYLSRIVSAPQPSEVRGAHPDKAGI